jgi:hypothetical protein
MPSVNTLSQYTFHNLGPLTSTWTAPASCATAKNPLYLAPANDPSRAVYGESCSVVSAGDCFPSGSALDSILAPRAGSPSLPYLVEIFSPGLVCPDNWSTVGVAVKDSAGSISSTGAFSTQVSVTASSTTSIFMPRNNPAPNVLMEALAPGETAIMCCPK